MGLGIARNISEGGMFVETRVPQPIGIAGAHHVFAPDGGEMTAVAEVRYVCHLLGRTPAAARGPLALRGHGRALPVLRGATRPRRADAPVSDAARASR